MIENAGSPNSRMRRKLSATERAAIWQAHGRRCAYTGEPITFSELEIDHVVPVGIAPAALRALKDDGAVPSGFDIDGLGNMLPTTRFQNSRKRADLRNRSALLHFLAVARQYQPVAEAYLRASADESRLLNAYLQLRAQAERNAVSVEDVVDLHRQEADGLTRVRQAIELEGASDLTLVNADLARGLMGKPFTLGGGTIGEVTLQDDQGRQTVCRDCRSFLSARDAGLWPRSQFDINCYGMAERTCEMLRRLEGARYAPASAIRYPRVTCADLGRWSSDWLRRVWVEFDEIRDGALLACHPTLADVAEAGLCTIVEASPWSFEVEPPAGFNLRVSELFRADLDGDGFEEILTFELAYATGGTFRAGAVVVARPGPDGIIRPVNLEDV